MALFLSQALHYVTSRGEIFVSGEEDHDDKAHALPFIASPVDPKAYAWLHHKKLTDPLVPGKVRRSRTVKDFEEDHGNDSALAGTIFRKQHEASSLELFFDLFFVGNLAVFTDNHAHVDAASVANYIGFFSILWSTWFHISMFDVRFYTDSSLSRFFKMLFFGVMVSFVALGPVYDAISGEGTTRAFTGISLVLMTLRFLLVIQYGIVLYFVHGFHKTLAPLLLTMGIYLLTGIGFLITYLVDRNSQLTAIEGARHVNRWYIIIGVEILAVIIVSSTWRILSFRHTHLVERVGLLTLIIMGEGILGLTKSLAYDVMGRNVSIWAETGLIASAVVLIYFIYVLYFNNVPHHSDENSWGTIRQQIWALLHYCLHVAILLTVEGQTALIIWHGARSGCVWFTSIFPSIATARIQYYSSAALVTAVNVSINSAAERFHYYKLSDYYNQTSDLTALQNISSPYGSPEWNASASAILQEIEYNIQYYIFVNFQAEASKEIEETSDAATQVALYNESFRVVFEYFYIAAGCFLLILAIMFWFCKKHLRKDEYFSFAIRVVVGMALPFVSIIALTESSPNDTSGFRYQQVDWLIPIVMMTYLGVLIADNLVKTVFSALRRRRRNSLASMAADEEAVQAVASKDQKAALRSIQHTDLTGDNPLESSASDITLGTMPAQANGGKRGYAYLDQDDAVQESDHQEGSKHLQNRENAY